MPCNECVFGTLYIVGQCLNISLWIAGPGCPLPRSPCPNKMKADLIENSIVRHMSEIQGFRLGEVIRYVTGNVPSSATAMYYLMNRKLRKHYGNLRASGKIAAESRVQQKPHISMETVVTYICILTSNIRF